MEASSATFVRRSRNQIHDVGTGHEGSRAIDDMIDLADLIMLGDTLFDRGGDFAAIDHGYVNVGLPDAECANLLIGYGDAFGALQISFQLFGGDIGGRTLVAGWLAGLGGKR